MLIYLFIVLYMDRFRPTLQSYKRHLSQATKTPGFRASLRGRIKVKYKRTKLQGLIVKTNLLEMLSILLLLSFGNHIGLPVDLSISLNIFLS
jgi:hypothetical protein